MNSPTSVSFISSLLYQHINDFLVILPLQIHLIKVFLRSRESLSLCHCSLVVTFWWRKSLTKDFINNQWKKIVLSRKYINVFRVSNRFLRHHQRARRNQTQGPAPRGGARTTAGHVSDDSSGALEPRICRWKGEYWHIVYKTVAHNPMLQTTWKNNPKPYGKFV